MMNAIMSKWSSSRLKDYLDYLAVYGSFGAIMWFLVPLSDWIFWLITAVILHFCLSSRLYFEFKLRRKKAIKQYKKNLREGQYGK